MKITVKGEKKTEFPYLGISKRNRTIVLFSSPECGIAINDPSSAPSESSVAYSNNWKMEEFRSFTGEIILSND